jgi:hypothetical protein
LRLFRHSIQQRYLNFKTYRDENLVFVLMPFRTKYFDLFEKVIKPVVKEKNLSCLKADDTKIFFDVVKWDASRIVLKSRKFDN